MDVPSNRRLGVNGPKTKLDDIISSTQTNVHEAFAAQLPTKATSFNGLMPKESRALDESELSRWVSLPRIDS